MEAILISVGLAPYLAGRTFLALGVVLAFYAFAASVRTGDFSPKALATNLVASAIAITLYVVLLWLKHFLEETLPEELKKLERRINSVWALVMGGLLAAGLLGKLGVMAWLAVASAPTRRTEPTGVLLAGATSDALVIAGAALLAYTFARLRRWLGDLFGLIPLFDVPASRKALTIAEAVFSVAGLLIALFFPWAGAVLALVLLVSFVWVGLLVRQLTNGARGPCEQCGKELHLAASCCPACRTARPPGRLGWFGRVVPGPAAPPAEHRLALVAACRCPSCAERLQAKAKPITCRACGEPPFRDEAEARAFLARADKHAMALAPFVALCSLVPVLGLGSALVLYRLSVAGSLGRYVTWHERFWTRLWQGFALVAMALLHPVPLLGAAALVGLELASHAWTRRAFLKSLAGSTAAPAAPLETAAA